MKTLLFALLLLSAPALAQTDSSYWPPPAESALRLRDTLNAERRLFLQSASENSLLHQQNERLMSRESRFWGVILLAAIAALAKGAAN